MQLQPVIILISVVVFVGFIAFRIELALPGILPSLYNIYTPLMKPTPQEISLYMLLANSVWQVRCYLASTPIQVLA